MSHTTLKVTFFSDIASFTSICESLNPEQLCVPSPHASRTTVIWIERTASVHQKLPMIIFDCFSAHYSQHPLAPLAPHTRAICCAICTSMMFICLLSPHTGIDFFPNTLKKCRELSLCVRVKPDPHSAPYLLSFDVLVVTD